MNQRAAEVAAPGAAHSPELGSLALWLFVACLPVLADPDAVARVAALHPLAAHAGVGLPLETALLVYVWAPMVVLSSFVLVLAPGLLLALLTPVARDGCRWLLAGFAISLFLVSALAGIAQSIAGDPFTGRAFSALIFVSGLATLAVVAGMRTRRPAGPLPPADPAFATTIAGMVAVAWVLMIALAPKIYWENLNGDGAHTLEATRLLLFQPVPFWLPGSGPIASFPGLTTGLFAYPGSWFMRLFGMHEAAVRLPFLLYLFLLFAVIVTLAEHGRRARLTALEQGLLWTGLSIYVVVMSYSATYNPYHADMGLPATQDTLMMVFFLAYALSFLERRHGAMCLYVGLSYFCSPAGLMLIGGWLVAVWLVERPRPWRSMLITVGAVVACKMLAAALPWVLEGLGLPLPGSEHSDFGLARKLRYLQWQDWRRFLFVAVPCGIVPAVALFAWRWQDRGARAFTVLTAGYFSFFYALGYISLHYFVPCMLLPLVVWWRGTALLDPRKRPWLLGATGVAAFAALAISLPRTGHVDTTSRVVGAQILDQFGGYETMAPAAFLRTELLERLFPTPARAEVPGQSFGGSPIAWNYYAHHSERPPDTRNYVIAPAGRPGPEGAVEIARLGEAVLYVRNRELWAAHRALRPPTPAGSALYAIPRGMLFRGRPIETGLPVLDLLVVMDRFGLVPPDWRQYLPGQESRP